MAEHPTVAKVLERAGYAQLNPAQAAAARSGLLSGKSVVVSAPTASGKTLIAELAALEAIKRGRKVVYLVPLRALASEKHEEFKQRYPDIRVALSSGDYDSADAWLGSADWIVATAEKMDSLLRHSVPWARDIGLVVADELHLLNDPERGPTLEVVLTRLRQIASPAILGLSATISNYKELAAWLEAEAVRSDYRPVPLFYGVAFENEATFQHTTVPNGRAKSFKLAFATQNHLEELTKHVLGLRKQQLVFVSTRKAAEAAAEQLIPLIAPKLSDDERKELVQLSHRTRTALEHPTAQCERLSRCIAGGAAFHHAGLAPAQRKLVETAFRSGSVKAVCATPTLAAGLNLPSYLTIVRDLKRFSSYRGMDYLPVLEVQQMLGRAGRPQYDEQGLGVLLARTETEARYAWEHYVQGEPEKIISKLGVEPVLRTHVLGLVASGAASSTRELQAFFAQTFYAHQYQETQQMNAHIDRVLALLEKLRFVEVAGKPDGPFLPADVLLRTNSTLEATKLGRRVAELYLDPLSAAHLISCLRAFASRGATALGFLHAIAGAREMKPSVSVRRGDRERLDGILLSEAPQFAQPPPEEWDEEFEDYLKQLKTALVLQGWADEWGEDRVLERYGVSPGELHARLSNADWLLYASAELALLLGHQALLNPLRKLRVRLSNGVKEELLPLIALKGVGRVRARKLYNAGFHGLAELRKAPLPALARVVGEKTAISIKEQVSTSDVQGTLEAGQTI